MTRKDLGLPDRWETVENWCRKPFRFGPPIDVKERKPTSFDHVDFSRPGTEEFWREFPSRELPDRPTTRINVTRLEELINEWDSHMTIHERDMAQKALKYLKEGAPAYQMSELPGISVKNAPSIMKCAPEFTETLKKWVEAGYAAGPFREMPLQNMRLNSLMAEEQKDKVRPVLNMSSPKGRSFNDNVDRNKLGRTTMSSAKQVGQALRKSGKGSLMSKMDMRDAYKLIPAKPEDYRLQGFLWHGSYFVETQMIFGDSPAVNNFDIIAKTLQMIARFMSQIPRELVQQTLDDTAGIGPPCLAGARSSPQTTRMFVARSTLNWQRTVPKVKRLSRTRQWAPSWGSGSIVSQCPGNCLVTRCRISWETFTPSQHPAT